LAILGAASHQKKEEAQSQSEKKLGPQAIKDAVALTTKGRSTIGGRAKTATVWIQKE
jgi:hypothetical protein